VTLRRPLDAFSFIPISNNPFLRKQRSEVERYLAAGPPVLEVEEYRGAEGQGYGSSSAAPGALRERGNVGLARGRALIA